MWAHLSLDGQQDWHSCFLLFAGDFAVTVDSQTSPSRLARHQHGKLIDELRQIQQYQLLFPAQGAKGPERLATVLSKQSIPQHLLAHFLGLDQLNSTARG